MSLEFKKGFLSQPAANTSAAARSVGRRKQAAAPDEAYLPAESYDLLDDEDGAADPLVAEIETSEAAYEYSVEYCRAHCNQFNQGLMRLDPMVNVAFANDLRAVQFNRKMWGHHDGPGRGGEQRTMLLPSGIVLKYLEWGSEQARPRHFLDSSSTAPRPVPRVGCEQAPPVVLLHDVCDSCHIWDDVAQPLADSFRVLALDLRGR